MAIATDAGRWSVKPVSNLTGLIDQLEGWRRALGESAAEPLFLQPEWVLPWLECYRRPPRALFGLLDGQPAAAAILVADRLGPAGRGPLVLRPPGLGVSDYLDLALPRDDALAEQALDALLDRLLQFRGWDLLDLPNLPAEQPTASRLASAASRRGLRFLRVATHRRPLVELAGTWDGYLAGRPQKLRYNLRSRRKRLASLGAVRYAHHTTRAELANVLPRAVELHAQRWAGQHTSTTFSKSSLARRFYAEALSRLAGLGQVDLATLELNDRLLAFALCFVHRERLYYYLPAFDPDYARFGPSTDLLAHLIEHGYQRGLREFDFMLGDESYKEPWATDARSTERLILAAPGGRATAALGLFRAYLAGREHARRSHRLQQLRRRGLGSARVLLGRLQS